MEKISKLQQARKQYCPKLPGSLTDGIKCLDIVEGEKTTHTNDSDYFAAGGTTLNAIYKPASATYFTGTNGVSAADSKTAVSSLVTNSAVPLATVGVGETKYYKVVVRLWLEGEDTTCTSQTFANLTDTWSLDLELQLGQGTPVTAMSMIDGYTLPAGG